MFSMHDTASGSSPRMRGAHGHSAIIAQASRIIPAYAGSTTGRDQKHRRGKDHPRVCGEHVTASSDGDFEKGSSPRMRGAPSLSGRWS